MSSLNVKSRRVSSKQLDILWEYLYSHKELAVAYNRSLQAKEYSKRQWKQLAETLNAQGDGCHKDWKGWSKYWVDYKAKLKAKVSSLRISRARTGGGPATEPLLTELEKKFLLVLGEDYGQGLQGVRVEPFTETQPRRRCRWREAPMSQEAARRALVKSSQREADAATRSASALERIAQGIEDGFRVLQSIDRAVNAVASRADE